MGLYPLAVAGSAAGIKTTQARPAPGGPGEQAFVLYHRDADGFASAFAAWCALGSSGVSYIDVQYNEPVPAIPDGARLFVVDFSYPRSVHLEWARRGIEQTVLDHHKTAEAELSGLGFAHFDMSKAGCELAWDYFSREENAPNGHACVGRIPWLLEAVADRDLWKFARKNTREICARLEIEPWDFDRWLQICLRVAEFDFVVEGRVLLALVEKTAKRQAKDWHLVELRGGRLVRACNAAAFTSETAHAMLEAHPEDELVAVYTFREGIVTVSLRGRGSVDVSAIAKLYSGGGGHRNAAGFSYEVEAVRLMDGTAAGAAGAEKDTLRVDYLEQLIRHCPHAEFYYTDDSGEEEPLGFSITVEGCEKSQVSGATFRECVDAEMALGGNAARPAPAGPGETLPPLVVPPLRSGEVKLGPGQAMVRRGADALHLWWELSYAQYLTIPRSVMQSMPDAWQATMDRQLRELDATIDWRPQDGCCYFVKLCRLREVWSEEDRQHVTVAGEEVFDPLADYQRGRRQIPHKIG